MDKRDLTILPNDLPIPENDGAADHLVPGFAVPHLPLPATDGTTVDLARPTARTVLFAYPRTGRPGEPSPGGDAAWDAIPGARGCTPQACAIRDLHAELGALGVRVLGLSTQSPEDQREAAARLRLPYPLLSDPEARLPVPTFVVEGVTLFRRTTLFLRDGRVEGVLYPVFPPDRAADEALAWLRAHP